MTVDGDYGVYSGAKIHFHVSGSISAALVPWWIHWFRHINSQATVNISVTRSAKRFVSGEALAELSNGEVWTDEWDASEVRHWRSGGTGDSDCIIVFPATLDTVMRLAHGRSDSPAMMMMQVTDLPIILCESLPGINPVIEHWRSVLFERPNVRVAPYLTAVKASDREEQESGFNLPGAIALANDLIRERNG